MNRALLPAFVFGVGSDATIAEIEARYLELVKRFPPDECAEEFAAVREAYEVLREQHTRVQSNLLEVPIPGSLAAIAKWSRANSATPRLTHDELKTLLAESLDE